MIRSHFCVARVAGLLALALIGVACASTPQTRHTLIPGTKVSLAIPEGFWLADGFPGISASDGAVSLVVTELPESEAAMRDEMTQDRLARRGMTLFATETVEVAGAERLLFHVSQARRGAPPLQRWILLLGDERSSAVLVATAPLSRAGDFAVKLETVMRTARRDPSRVVGPFEGLGFTVEASESLEISERVSGVVTFVSRGDRAGAGPGNPIFIAARSYLPGSLELESFAIQRLVLTPEISNVAVVSSRHIEIDGLAAFEVVASAVDTEADLPITLFQTIAVDGQRYYLMQGMVASSRAERFLPEFREIATGFRRTD